MPQITGEVEVGLITVEQITDEQLDQIVELANLQWRTAPRGTNGEPLYLTHLMACHILRAYFAVLQDNEASVIKKVEELKTLARQETSGVL